MNNPNSKAAGQVEKGNSLLHKDEKAQERQRRALCGQCSSFYQTKKEQDNE